MTNLPKYTAWANVPEHLKTKTALNRMGKKPAKKQKPKAKFYSTYSGPNGYPLYDLNEAEAKRKPSQKQLDALAKARQTAQENLIKRCTCNQCGGWCDENKGLCEECKHLNFLRDSRWEAIEWAKKVLKGEFIILDTETTDKNLVTGEPVEISIINHKGETLFNSHLNPKGEINPEAQTIHRLSKADLATAPTFAQVYNQLKAILEGAKEVIIYNADFDTQIIQNACEIFNLAPISFSSWCAMMWYAQYYGQWHHHFKSFTWQKLPGGDHTALGDCKATLKLIKAIANTSTEVEA